jgi:hypothetical protein
VPPELRLALEPRFGSDFEHHLRTHTDLCLAKAAASIGARSVTRGLGRRLLAIRVAANTLWWLLSDWLSARTTTRRVGTVLTIVMFAGLATVDVSRSSLHLAIICLRARCKPCAGTGAAGADVSRTVRLQ